MAQQLEEGPSQGPHGAQEAVVYRESGQPGPHMDSEYRAPPHSVCVCVCARVCVCACVRVCVYTEVALDERVR